MIKEKAMDEIKVLKKLNAHLILKSKVCLAGL
jgi:hypothetical protein